MVERTLENRYLTVEQLSKYLSIKPQTLYVWATTGKIPAHKIEKLIRFSRVEIDDWVKTKKIS